MQMSEREENRKRLEDAVANADPALLAKYGNPLDPTDPRHWEPTVRGERGISLNDRVRLLELDMEVIQQSLARIVPWMLKQQEKEFLDKFANNPSAALEELAQMMESAPKSRGANGNEGPAFAGSTRGLQPGDQVETPDGIIRADQIPGYRNDPDWSPSPDWAEANCMCAIHQAKREAAARDNRFQLPGDGPTGMYL
jgi:hypothetical protein